MRPVVGFDLDLTLVDSADGIVATFAEAARRVGVSIDPEAMRPLIGVPLETACEALLPPHLVEPVVRRVPGAVLDTRGAENDVAAGRR